MIVIAYNTICSNPDLECIGSQIIICRGSGKKITYDYIKPSLAQEAWEELIYAISKKGNIVIDMRLFELFSHKLYYINRDEAGQPKLCERENQTPVVQPSYLPSETGAMAQERFIRALKQAELLKR